MLKTITTIVLSLLMTTTLFTPSFDLLTDNYCTVISMSPTEKENPENKKNEIEDFGSEENEIEFTLYDNVNYSLSLNPSIISHYCPKMVTNHVLDIQIPPPEYVL